MMGLWNHQREGISAISRQSMMLVWPPGTGKTRAALTAGLEKLGGNQLYVCPASLRWQVAEQARELFPDAKVQVVQSLNDNLLPASDLTVISYNMASDKRLWAQLYGREWGSVVADECKEIKNKDALRTRAVYGKRPDSKGALLRKCNRLWPMDGTPVLNSPVDLWVHYSRLFPQVLGNKDGSPLNYMQWVDRFCIQRVTPYGFTIVGGKNLAELHDACAPFMHQCRKKLGVSLRVDNIPVEPTDINIKLIEPEAQRELMRLLPDWDGDVPFSDELRPMISTLRRQIGLAKVPVLADLIGRELENGREKVVMMGLHPDVLRGVAHLLDKHMPLLFHGGMTDKEKQDAKHRFITCPANRVFLGQIRAAGQGLDGLQKVCSRIFIAEPSWTPAWNAQAIARLFRSGQGTDVYASFVSLRGSIDDHVNRVLARKEKIIKMVMGEA